MKTNSYTGRNYAAFIGGYIIAKAILNMILGGGFSVSDLLLGVGMTCMLISGLQFVNYVIAAILVIVAVKHLPDNISNIGSNWIYLLEGIADIICAVLLCVQKDIKLHFTNKWNELQDIFSK